MDTNDLSEQAYRCLITAEGFSHDLTIEFGVLASRSGNENEFLKEAKLMIQEIEEEIDYFLEENIREEHRDKKKLIETLKQIESNIDETLEIPFEKRTFDGY
jgi:hypothetical protein